MDKLLYYIEPSKMTFEEVRTKIENHPEIKFISLIGVDLGNNHTDEKIPVDILLKDFEVFLKNGVQTDGSSVNLDTIAVINNAKVDMIPDISVKWLIDYNFDNIDPILEKPIGTLVIPSFLKHGEDNVDSRSILNRAQSNFKSKIRELINSSEYLRVELGLEEDEQIESVVLTTATELEFWVNTPGEVADIDKLSTSQELKEQYWKRTVGPVRTALETSMIKLNNFGFQAEMGHKEVGGIPAKLGGLNKFSDIMEQLEIDWKFDEALQSADNELFARDIISENFVRHGLEVTFMAKPIEGVAGSGEHHHMGVGAVTSRGRFLNLFSPVEMDQQFMSAIGLGALMGLLKNYEIVNPFVTSTNDGFNRLKPGFEAPVCTVCSLGHTESTSSRNRAVLVGLVRDVKNPNATRFEMRSPNPNSNTYLTLASSFQAMLDGISAVASAEKTYGEILANISKQIGEESFYLEKDRMYRSEEDVFEYYTAEERDEYFGNPPKTVWENMASFDKYDDKVNILTDGEVFTESIINSYKAIYLEKWSHELRNRIIPNNIEIVRHCSELHHEEDFNDLDKENWEKISTLRHFLMKDSLSHKSLFTHIRDALDCHEYEKASTLQIEMGLKMKELSDLYAKYKINLLSATNSIH